MVFPAGCAEPIALLLRRPDLENQYLYPQLFTALMYLVASVSMLLVRAWKLGDLDRTVNEMEQRQRERGVKPDVEPRGSLDWWGEWGSSDTSRWIRYAFV